jgi:hypothetical protein
LPASALEPSFWAEANGRDPLAKFEESLSAFSEADKGRFYAGNMADLLGKAPQ